MIFAVLGLAYFFPTIVAVLRRHRQQTPILILNLFLGWTLLFWVIALAMASSAQDRARAC